MSRRQKGRFRGAAGHSNIERLRQAPSETKRRPPEVQSADSLVFAALSVILSCSILSGDGSAILLPRHVGNVYSESVCFRHGLLLPTPLHVQAHGRDAPLPRGRLGCRGRSGPIGGIGEGPSSQCRVGSARATGDLGCRPIVSRFGGRSPGSLLALRNSTKGGLPQAVALGWCLALVRCQGSGTRCLPFAPLDR